MIRHMRHGSPPPSAAHTTPWPRPRQSRGLWPEARWSEGAAPPSRPCRTGTAAPELKRSDDPPHAPWFASAPHGPSVYPQPQPSGIPADPFSRSPYHTVFGKLAAETVESLIVRVANEALAHAGIGPADVDEILLGHFNAGFSPQDFTASIVLQASDALRFKPTTRVENACATGSAAVHQAIKSLEAGRARITLVVGVEQMTHAPSADIARNLLKASYLAEDGETPGGFAGVFGRIAASYFQRHGDQSDALALIAAKNHQNGVANPYAQIRKDLGFAFCRQESEKNPFVAGPLKRTDCSLVSDGAAALVIADPETT